MEQDEVGRFGELFRRFLEQVVHVEPADPGRAGLVERLEQHLGADPADLPLVQETYLPFEHATIQVAIDAITGREEPGGAELIGVGGGQAEHHSFSDMLQLGRHHGMFTVGPPQWTSVAVSVDAEMACVSLGIYLVSDGDDRLAVMLRAGSEHTMTSASIDVVSADVATSRAWLARLRAERTERNLLRGQVLSFGANPFEAGTGPVTFHRRPELSRADVVLPASVLDRVDRQVAGIARHRERLRREGRHLKRGVLLYGPPGTGKTHSVRWLTGRLRDFTVVLLTGNGIGAMSTACALARTLQPALIVLEDVDLVAHDRAFSPNGSNPLLFTVLDEMDGLAADSDVAFLLTTNRVDLLEPALAQRPGRVDLAVEVPLPDGAARRALLALYGRGIDVSDEQAAAFVDRSAGAPASFVKEAARRASLLAAEGGDDHTTGAHLLVAVAELVEAQDSLTGHSLGGPGDGEEPAPELEHGGEAGPGWFAYGARPAMYRSHLTYGG